MIRLLLALVLAAALPLAPAPSALAGEVQQLTLASEVLGRPWRLAAYLPDGHADSGRPYPMLFFLLGYGATQADAARLDLAAAADAAIAAGTIPPAVVVVAETGHSWGLDGTEAMQTALLEELVPMATRRWRGIDARHGRAIGGISAGGHAALHLAMLHPDRFAAAVLLSPAVYVPVPPPRSAARSAAVFGAPGFRPELWAANNWPALLPGLRARGIALPLFIASGSGDHLGIAAQAETLAAAWRAAGMPVEVATIPGGHDSAVWRALLPQALAYAFRHAVP